MFTGVIAPNLTFFNEAGELDYEKCRIHMEWILDRGTSGLFVTGTYGSGFLLSIDERATIYRIAKEVVQKRPGTYVVSHVGCPDLKSTIQLAHIAKEIGIDAVSAIAPFNYKYTHTEIIKYYSMLVDATDIPVYAYNNPEVTGTRMTIGQIKEFMNIGIAGLKDSAIDSGLATYIYCANMNNGSGKHFQYIPGTNSGWPAFRKLGASAMITGMCNYAPELTTALFKLSFDDWPKATKLYIECLDLSAKIKEENSLVSSHLALKARGFDPGFMRLPLSLSYDGKEDRIAEIKEHIDHALSLLQHC